MTRTTFLAAGWLPLALLITCPLQAADKPSDALKSALDKTTSSGSYAFSIDEGGAGPTGKPVEVKYQKGQPLWCQAEGLECYKKGEEVVYKQGDGWLRSKRGTVSDPLRVLGAIARVRTVILPHEELAGFQKHFKEVKETKENGEMVYSGDLTDEAVKKLARPNFTNVARSGTAKVWVNGDGVVTKYTIAIEVRGRIGNAEIEGTPTRTITISGLDKTKVEVPEAARKALE
jgi:hypothetical protein